MSIEVLRNEIINQIAAGEVIERPLSIVKELMENSIDAGASSIAVEIKDGGISLIRVTDNGCGIDKNEVRTAFLRHATSKIRDTRDLDNIHTLGFRGEALASIAAVSYTEMISRKAGSIMATHYVVDGGFEKDFSDIGAPEGTTMIVRDLFKNVPARRKFLKSATTEASKIQDIVEMASLSHTEVSFRLIIDGRQRFQTLGNGALLDAIYSIYGSEMTKEMTVVNQGYQPDSLTGLPNVTVRGFIGKPSITKSNRGFEIYFVNGRYVKNPTIMKAIEDAYRPFLMMHKYPFTVLLIDVNPHSVDVNVHPQKMEVRFSDGIVIYNSVMDAIQKTLSNRDLIRQTSLTDDEDAVNAENALDGVGAENKMIGNANVSAGATESGVTNISAATTGSSTPNSLESSKLSVDVNSDNTRSAGAGLGVGFGAGAGSAPGTGYEKATSPMTHDISSFSQNTAADTLVVADNHVAPSHNLGAGDIGIDRNSHIEPFETKRESRYINEQRTIYDAKKNEAMEKAVQETLFDDRFLTEKAKSEHRIIGQVFDTYWIIEYKNEMYIIDQHAAHEKVNFERIMKRVKEHEPVSQNIYPPVLLTLSNEEGRMLEEYSDYFAKIGYSITFLGGHDYSISSVPADLPEIGKKELLIEMLDTVSLETGMVTPESIYYKIASMSCKAAVKGNNHLSLMEADALITELLSLENPYACPHGRPTIISISKTELEKKFKRIV